MSGDVWQVERYNLRKRTWEPFGRPSTDFEAQYKKVSALQACGSKARLAKVTAKPSAAETPEQKTPAGETWEDKAKRLGCTCSVPFNCEDCNLWKRCPVTGDDIPGAQEE